MHIKSKKYVSPTYTQVSFQDNYIKGAILDLQPRPSFCTKFVEIFTLSESLVIVNNAYKLLAVAAFL